MDKVRKRDLEELFSSGGIIKEEEEIIARSVIEWNLNKTIPISNKIDKTIYTCKYRVSGATHDGYCTDAESEPFEPYYLLRKYNPVNYEYGSESDSDSDSELESESELDYSYISKLLQDEDDNILLLKRLSYTYKGCHNYGASNYCSGSFMKYKAVEVIPFYHRYLHRMEIDLDACEYCWNNDCSTECINSIPPPNG